MRAAQPTRRRLAQKSTKSLGSTGESPHYLKVTGGSLKVRALLSNAGADLPEEKVWEEKVNQIRIYSGAKYQAVDEALAGAVCAVTGLSKTYPGEGLGMEASSEPPVLEPVLTYQVLLPYGYDPHTAMQKLSQLEEEDPQLHIVWNGAASGDSYPAYGRSTDGGFAADYPERFGLDVAFGAGNIVYRETITAPVEGVGHYEPLRIMRRSIYYWSQERGERFAIWHSV